MSNSEIVWVKRGKKRLGSPTTWWRHYVRDRRDLGEVRVPCNGCTACCRSSKLFVDLTAEEAARFEHVIKPLRGKPTPVLPKRADGSCVHLVDGKCAVYADRPHGCKVFDCRVAAFGDMIVRDNPVLTEALLAWNFPRIVSPEDREIVAAIKMAYADDPAKEGVPNAGLRWEAYIPAARDLIRAFEALPHAQRRAFEEWLRAQAEEVMKATSREAAA